MKRITAGKGAPHPNQKQNQKRLHNPCRPGNPLRPVRSRRPHHIETVEEAEPSIFLHPRSACPLEDLIFQMGGGRHVDDGCGTM